MKYLELTANLRGGRVTLAVTRCRKPTIAAIQGPAVGVRPFLMYMLKC